jgi:hypothetical protein
MITFLQYVCERLMGPPAKLSAQPGESWWCCPFHKDTDPSFHTMPSDPAYKDRFRCFGCGKRGGTMPTSCSFTSQASVGPTARRASNSGAANTRRKYNRKTRPTTNPPCRVRLPLFFFGERGRKRSTRLK